MAQNQRTNDDRYQVRAAPPEERPPPLPSAPDIDRRIRFHTGQLIGLALIVSLPVLALAGVFGISTQQATAFDEALGVTVEYPARHRYKVRQPLDITITNVSEADLARVEIGLTTNYIDAFSDVAFTPAPDHIDARDHVFVIAGLDAGETRSITAEMQAQVYGPTTGHVTWTATTDSGEVVSTGELELRTTIWP